VTPASNEKSSRIYLPGAAGAASRQVLIEATVAEGSVAETTTTSVMWTGSALGPKARRWLFIHASVHRLQTLPVRRSSAFKYSNPLRPPEWLIDIQQYQTALSI
jgi:hypothetical protein